MHFRGAVVLLLLVAATPEVKYFRYEQPLAAPVAKAGQTCVVLDAGIYAHAEPGLQDVRLYRGTGAGSQGSASQGSANQETPYAIREAAPVEQRQKEIAPLNLGSRDGQTVFDAAIPDEEYSDVELGITATNFIATVTVTGSQAQTGGEQTKVGAYTVFDLTGQKLGRSTLLHLPESDFRYLHFVIAGPVKPEEITGLTIEWLPAKQQYVTVSDTNTVTQKGKESVVTLQVPAHVPVERIVFTVGATPANFSRDVTVKVEPVVARRETTEEEVPQPVESSGSLLRLHASPNGHRIDEEHLAMDAPGADFGEMGSMWTVTVDNGDDVPLAITDVRLEMTERHLCFDAAAGAAYTLMYGDVALSAPRYDYATLFVADAHAAQATLGPEKENPEYQARPDTRAFTEKHPALLWVALVAVVLVLGAVAVRTAKETNAG
jgi:hypothetical protein